jgi:hypothetical protein
MDKRFEEKIVEKVNKLTSNIANKLTAYFIGGQKGPLPMLSLGASNSATPQAQSEPQDESPIALVTSADSNTVGLEDSSAVAASSPSLTCTPISLSMLSELDGLMVIN